MEYLDLDIYDKDRYLIKNNDGQEECRQMCLQELALMKLTKFYDNVSALSILVKSQKIIAGYACNKELVER